MKPAFKRVLPMRATKDCPLLLLLLLILVRGTAPSLTLKNEKAPATLEEKSHDAVCHATDAWPFVPFFSPDTSCGHACSSRSHSGVAACGTATPTQMAPPVVSLPDAMSNPAANGTLAAIGSSVAAEGGFHPPIAKQSRFSSLYTGAHGVCEAPGIDTPASGRACRAATESLPTRNGTIIARACVAATTSRTMAQRAYHSRDTTSGIAAAEAAVYIAKAQKVATALNMVQLWTACRTCGLEHRAHCNSECQLRVVEALKRSCCEPRTSFADATGEKGLAFPATGLLAQTRKKKDGEEAPEAQPKIAHRIATGAAASATTRKADDCRVKEDHCENRRRAAGEEDERERESRIPRVSRGVTVSTLPNAAGQVSNAFDEGHHAHDGGRAPVQRNSGSHGDSEPTLSNTTSSTKRRVAAGNLYRQTFIDASLTDQHPTPVEEKRVDLSEEAVELERPVVFAPEKWTRASLQYGFGALRPFCQLCLHALRGCEGLPAAGSSMIQSKNGSEPTDFHTGVNLSATADSVERDSATTTTAPTPPGRRKNDGGAASISSDGIKGTVNTMIPDMGNHRGKDAARSPGSASLSLLHSPDTGSPFVPKGIKITPTISTPSTKPYLAGDFFRLDAFSFEEGGEMCQAVCGVNCTGLGASLTIRQKCLWCAAQRGRCVAWKGCDRDCKEECAAATLNSRHELQRARRKRQRVLQLYRDGKLDEFLSASWKRKSQKQQRVPRNSHQDGRATTKQSAKPQEPGLPLKKKQLEGPPYDPQQEHTERSLDAEKQRVLQSQWTSQERYYQDRLQHNFSAAGTKDTRQRQPDQGQQEDEHFATLADPWERPVKQQGGSERGHRVGPPQPAPQHPEDGEDEWGKERKDTHHRGGAEAARTEQDGHDFARDVGGEEPANNEGPAPQSGRTEKSRRSRLMVEAADVEGVKELSDKTGLAKRRGPGHKGKQAVEVKTEILQRAVEKTGRTTTSGDSGERQSGHGDTVGTEELENLLRRLLREEENEATEQKIARKKEEERRVVVEAIEKRNEERARKSKEARQAAKNSEKTTRDREGQHKEDEEEDEETLLLWMSPLQRRHGIGMDPTRIRAALYTTGLK